MRVRGNNMRAVHPKLQRNHIGLDGFIWSIGVVEDRFDPLLLGRCKVRYFGWHTEDKEMMPTEKLPWSYALTDLDSGRNVVGPKEGDWVVGFFRDGIVAQEPVMIGVVPGIPEIEANPEIGFNDPRPDGILAGHQVPRDPLSFPVQHDDGTGSDLFEMGVHSRFPQNESADPLLKYVDQKESTANRFERNEFIDQTIVEIKKENIAIGQMDIPTANHPNSAVGTDKTSAGTEWTESETDYATKYPYNHAYFSEGGHLIEVDDTPFAERLHWYHRSGTFKEIHAVGLTVEKIVDAEHHIVLKGRWTHIEADDNETVDWNKKVFINKDRKNFNYDITVGSGGDYNVTLEKGQYNKYVMNGDENIRIKKNRYYLIEEDQVGHIIKDKCVTVENDSVLHVYGHANIVVHKNGTVRIYGDAVLTVDGNADIKVKGDTKYECDGSLYSTIRGSKYEIVYGNDYKFVYGSQYNQILMNRNDSVALTQNRYTGVALNEYCGVGDYGVINIVSPEIYLNYQVPGTEPPIEPAEAYPIPMPIYTEKSVDEATLIKNKLPEQK